MSVPKPKWIFERTARCTWTWRFVGKPDVMSDGAVASLEEAIKDAVKHGFDPLTNYWIARADGCTTHHRPRRAAAGLPSAGLAETRDPAG